MGLRVVVPQVAVAVAVVMAVGRAVIVGVAVTAAVVVAVAVLVVPVAHGGPLPGAREWTFRRPRDHYANQPRTTYHLRIMCIPTPARNSSRSPP